MKNNYLVQLHITRHITAVIQASDTLEARKMASNLEFHHQIDGGIIAWTVVDVKDSEGVGSDDLDLGSPSQASTS